MGILDDIVSATTGGAIGGSGGSERVWGGSPFSRVTGDWLPDLVKGALLFNPVTGPFVLLADALKPPRPPGMPGEGPTLINVASNIMPINVIYGSRKVGGTRVLTEVSGASNEFLHLIIVLGEGKISAINTVYLDDVASTDARFTGLVTVEKHLGTDAQSASAALIAALPTKWSTDHRGAGVAYIYVQLKYDRSAFPRGLPTITADVNGREVFNADTSVTEFTHNPAWCIRDYLTNTRYGRGIAASMIDDASFIAAAAHCDTTASIPTGGTQALYTCDGVVNVNTTAYDNVKSMCTSCRGRVKFSNGKYRLVIDKAETPAFSFDEDNITGSWSIKQPGRKEKYNRVTASFFNPARNWQPDIAIQQSLTYTIEDGGRLSESKIDLPYTSDIYRAQHIVQMEMKRSRFGVTVQFSALPEALRCEAGDVVYLTHETPGWVAKPFRITSMELKDNDEVGFTLAEYDPGVYTLDALNVAPSVGVTNLPNPFAVAAPGAPVIAEELYQTTGSSGVKTKAIVTCEPSPDIYVQSYHLDFKLATDTVWRKLSSQESRYWEIADLAPGIYQARVSAINSMGVESAYSVITAKEIVGLTALPADIAGFSMLKIGGVAVGAWALSGDLDVRIGGRTIVRHSPLTSGAVWSDGYVLDEFTGDAITGLLPLITGTYMIKARDSSGNYSLNISSFVATEGMITGFTTVGTSTQAAGFTGTKINVTLSSGSIKLTDTSANLTGSYEFDTYLDMTTVATRRFEADLTSLSYDESALIDSMTALIDSWDFIDGWVVNDCDVTLYAATTDTDPAGSPVWSEWTPFFVAEFTARAAKFKLDFLSGQAGHNILVSQLTVHAKI